MNAADVVDRLGVIKVIATTVSMTLRLVNNDNVWEQGSLMARKINPPCQNYLECIVTNGGVTFVTARIKRRLPPVNRVTMRRGQRQDTSLPILPHLPTPQL